MVSNNLDKVTCPKCDNSEDIFKFEENIYIVRNNDEFVRRKLYGCKRCKNLFTYDDIPRKEAKNIGVQNIFSKISKQCDTALGGITIKH